MLTARGPEKEATKLVIDRLWCVSDPAAEGFETLLPSGRAQIIFSLDVPLDEYDPAAPQHRFGSLHVLQGPSTQPRRIARASQASSCGVSFSPGGAGALFGPVIEQTTDKVIDLARLWGDEAGRIVERLRGLVSHRARLDLLEAEVGSRLRDLTATALLAGAIDRLRQGVAIKKVCADEGLSPHVFRKLFLTNVGMTPKRYLRIERFRDALGRLTPDSSLSDVAFDADFADQSHMTREVERFADMTPGRLRASNRPYAGHVLDPSA
jgi:AraC-like DNA-binding protein